MSLDLQALETSFDLVAPRGDELMDEFYSRLFAAAPAVQPLFPDDMQTAEDDAPRRARAAAQVAAQPRRDRPEAARARRPPRRLRREARALPGRRRRC